MSSQNKSKLPKYHLLSARVSLYNSNTFKELLEEEQQYNGFVYWCIGTSKSCYHIKKGDICCFCYNDLPDGTSRILLIGKVEETDYNNSGNLIFNESDGNDKYIKLKLKSINLRNNKEQFSFNNLKNKYRIINPNTRQWNHLYIDRSTHSTLIEDLEEAESRGKSGLKITHDYFKEYIPCIFNGIDLQRKNHETFIEQNGMPYSECHHLVEKKLLKHLDKITNIDKLIKNPNNLYLLCPNCHKEIHHGVYSRRKEKINYLYNLNKEFFDNNFNELKEGKTTLDWLYSIYDCDKEN